MRASDSLLERTVLIPKLCKGKTCSKGGPPLDSRHMVRAVYFPSLLSATSYNNFLMESSYAAANEA